MRFFPAIVAVFAVQSALAAPAPLTAAAYHPSGRFLAVGSYGEVVFIDPAKGEVLGRLGEQTRRVTSLAFSTDGKKMFATSGVPGKSGEVRGYAVPDTGLPGKAERMWTAHKDTILATAISPDGSTLATAGYDRLIRFWNTADGKAIQELKDHSDSVYSLSFHPQGKLLASASADRTVKVWRVDNGNRIYTLSEPTDWVYAVTWSPDGKRLAAGGIDKSIRIWLANDSEGKLVGSAFAHTEPVSKLIFSADSATLFSASEGKNLKSWDVATLKEKLVFPAGKESNMSVALSPNGKQIAVGRFDGSLQLIDTATGKEVAQPLPAKPKLMKATPNFAPRGKTVRVELEGENLGGATEVTADLQGVSAKIVGEATANRLAIDLTLPANLKPGLLKLGVKTAAGTTAPLHFTVDRYAAVVEKPATDSARIGTRVTLPATLTGTLQKAGDADYFRFEAEAGREIGIQVLTAEFGSKLAPMLELTDANGRVLIESDNGLLAFKCDKAGTYAIGIRDKEFRGGADFTYRIHAGDVPIVTCVFPMAVQRGGSATVALRGVNLSSTQAEVKIAADAIVGSRVPVVLPATRGENPLGEATVIVGEFPEIPRPANANIAPLPVPGTLNGILAKPGETQLASFKARKGEKLIVEVDARRSGSPLDSAIEILDAAGKPVPRVALRCTARVFSTFRDHDSASPGIRLESWNDLAMNDYLFVGGEVMRIHQLPKNPDDDCQFYTSGGRRQGFLDTTPRHHAMGVPMYKVEFHPPGSTFPPNGMPTFQLDYRNDDGGPAYGKDSSLTFDAPADGEYRVRIRDSRGEGGANFYYRLTVRAPRPDFSLTFSPSSPKVWKGGAIPVSVSANRVDGYSGPIKVKFENLPAGFSAPESTIEADQLTATFALSATADAAAPANPSPALKIVGTATIESKEIKRHATGTMPVLAEGADIVTTTNLSEVAIKPGAETKLIVTIERRNGFKARVPIEVRGLPYGTRVLDIGLNGILITEKDTSREIVIYAEPWVKPMQHPIVVLAKKEATGSEHAAKSVLLKVEK